MNLKTTYFTKTSQLLSHFLMLQLVFLFVFTPVQAEDKPEIRVGWIGPLTGDAAFLGLDSVQIVRDRFEEINTGKSDFGELPFKIKLLVQDDQYSTSQALSAYTKMRNTEQVQIFIALTYGAVVSFSERFSKDNVVVIDPLDCDQEIADLADNVFCIAKTTEHVGELLAETAVKLGANSPGLIYVQKDPFAPKVAAAVRSKVRELGRKVSLSQGISDDMGDFRDILTKVRSRKSDALFILGNDDFGLALKQARQLGIKVPFYAFASVTSPGFRALAGEALEGTIVAGWFAPRTSEYAKFTEKYRAKYGRDLLLEVGSVPSFDVANIIVMKLLEQSQIADGKVDMERFKQDLYELKDYQGLSGTITIDADGAVRTLNGKVKRYVKGELVDLDVRE